MALLLLRDALNLTTNPDDEDDPTAFFSVWGIFFTYYTCLSFLFMFVLILLVLVLQQLFLLRAAGFLLPCYIMAWAIGILQRRRQRQVCTLSQKCSVSKMLNLTDKALMHCFLFLWHQEAALAAAEVAFMIHGGVPPQRRGLHFAVAPEQPAPIPNQTLVWSFKAMDSPVRLIITKETVNLVVKERPTYLCFITCLSSSSFSYVCVLWILLNVTSLLLNVVTVLSCTVLWLCFCY